MSAYLTTTITVKDLNTFQDYAAQARPVIAAYGGETLMVGRMVETLVGAVGHQLEVVLRFADIDALKAWYESPEYQILIPIRDAGADVVFKVLEDI